MAAPLPWIASYSRWALSSATGIAGLQQLQGALPLALLQQGLSLPQACCRRPAHDPLALTRLLALTTLVSLGMGLGLEPPCLPPRLQKMRGVGVQLSQSFFGLRIA